MKKKFSLQTMELAEAATKDAPNFGLSASIEEKDGEISIAYDSPAMCDNKETKAVSMEDVYAVMRSVASSYEYELKWLREDMSYTRDAFFKHVNNGHIPAILDGGIMKKALKSLGLEDSYQVSIPTVFVQY